ncbi:hypothetical protein [Pseudomonas putida]|uniref:hypothetical protein n=1 Tax=Pseudomonas putida TaxID=303 RepID=UPI0004214A45|nr:hypothetical protein [Pseudomonas putida]
MSIVLQGHKLNQRQLDAITPVMNDLMQGRVSQKKFEQACVDAIEAAGCPLGYDTTMPGADKTVEQRASAWMRDGEVGMSSRAIHDHMLGLTPKCGYFDYPLDPDDLNRCIKLLELIPEWKPRMGEMAQRGEQWVGLANRWEEICRCFLDEVGLDWCKGRRAPKTYLLMTQAMGERP